jgi:hypothetical protein
MITNSIVLREASAPMYKLESPATAVVGEIALHFVAVNGRQ